ncbi:unnamed protein product, partial [Meganyctiphanes norvegica]
IVPGVPNNVQAIGFSNGSISVAWESPNRSNCPVEEYDVKLTQLEYGTYQILSTLDLGIVFEDLIPGLAYNISVIAVNTKGKGNDTKIISVTIPTESCEDPFFALGDTCYQVIVGSYNWYQARQLCQEQNADLLQTHSLKFLHNSIMEHQYNNPSFFWMGASDEDEEGSWKWLSGEPVSSDTWGIRQPDYNIEKNCMQLRYNQTDHYHILHAYCDDIKTVICEKPISPSNDQKLYTQIGSEHFLVVNELMDWNSAREICQNKGGELATPKDLELLRNWIKNDKASNSSYFWLGASDIEREGNWLWLNGSIVEHGWMKGEPDNRDYDENCLLFMTQYDPSLNDNSCYRSQSFICELKEDDPFFSLGNEKFLVVEEWKTWDEARTSCINLGGDLAEPKDLELLKTHLSEHDQIDSDYWIGGSDSENEGSWKWISGATVNTSLWIDGEPDGDEIENCLDFQPLEDPPLNDYECEETQYYICEKTEGKRNVISDEECNYPFEKLGSDCLLIVENSLKDWQEANRYCQRNNADLAILNDLNKLRKHLARFDIEYNYWVGGSKLNSDREWLWVNGDPFTEEWRDGEPDDNIKNECLLFQAGYRPSYSAHACGREQSFICKKNTIRGKSVDDSKRDKHPNYDLSSKFEKTGSLDHDKEETTEEIVTTDFPEEVTNYFE